MKTFGLSNKHDGLNWKALNMFRNVLHYDEHVQMLIFIGLAELDWKRTWGDNYVMIKRAWAGPTLNSWRKGVRPALLFFFCFTFLWVNHNLLSNSYQLLSVRACSTCSDFFFFNFNAHVLVQTAEGLSASVDLFLGATDPSLDLFPRGLPAWHCATPIK